MPDEPVWCFEVGGPGEAAEGLDVLGAQEEGVVELVFVDEEVGRESKVGMQFAAGVWAGEVVGGEGEGEGRVQAGGVREGGCVG